MEDLHFAPVSLPLLHNNSYVAMLFFKLIGHERLLHNCKLQQMDIEHIALI